MSWKIWRLMPRRWATSKAPFLGYFCSCAIRALAYLPSASVSASGSVMPMRLRRVSGMTRAGARQYFFDRRFAAHIGGEIGVLLR